MIKRKFAQGITLAAHPSRAAYLLGVKLMQSLASSQLDHIPSRPFQITFFLLNRCNLQCPYCSFFGQANLWGNTRQASLDAAALSRFIQQIPWATDITFTGGEPLLHPEIDSLLSTVGSSKHTLTLFTNGTLLKQHKQPVSDLVDTLCLSVDGADAKTHDFFRQGSFQKIVSSLSELYALSKRKPKLILHFTLHPHNIAQLPRFPDFLKQLTEHEIPIAHVQFQHLFAAPLNWKNKQQKIYQQLFRYKPKQSSLPFYQNGSMDIDLLLRNSRLLEKKMPVPFSFFPKLRRDELRPFYQEKAIPPAYRKPCLAAHTQLVVFPNGEVQICPDYSLGNIHKDSLQTMLLSERLQQLRSYLAKGSLFPFCQTCCHLYKW